MYGATIADGIDDTYVSNDASFSKFVSTLNTLKPTLIVAGSRGAELVARLLEEDGETYEGTVLLLGPVYLSRVIDTKRKNHIVIANNHKQTTLIEATNKGHNLKFENKKELLNVIHYVVTKKYVELIH